MSSKRRQEAWCVEGIPLPWEFKLAVHPVPGTVKVCSAGKVWWKDYGWMRTRHRKRILLDCCVGLLTLMEAPPLPDLRIEYKPHKSISCVKTPYESPVLTDEERLVWAAVYAAMLPGKRKRWSKHDAAKISALEADQEIDRLRELARDVASRRLRRMVYYDGETTDEV